MKIIGHAGARGLAPPNTIAGFKKALQHKVDAIEFDVRVTKDNIPILNHDPFVLNPLGEQMIITDHSLPELRKHNPELATLEGAIRVINHAVPLHIEVKPSVSTQPIITLIQQLLDNKWSAAEFSFASFDQRILLALHHAFPDCDMIVLDRWSGLRATRHARQLGTKRICMNQRWLWGPFVRAVSRRGYLLSAYTVNSPRQATRWQKLGLSGIVTDFPDRFTNARKL